MSAISTRIPLKCLTVVGVLYCLGFHHARGASILEKLMSTRSRTKRVPSNDETSTRRCTLDNGIHRQLTEIETDIQSIFIRYIFETPGEDLVDSTTCFPSLASSSGRNGQWIAARVEQIRQFMPWYRQIESHAGRPDSVLAEDFYPTFLGLVNMINSTIDRLERRMETLKNRSSCGCSSTVLDASQVLTDVCHVRAPSENISQDTFRRNVSSVVRLLLLIINDLHSSRVQRPLC